LVLPLLTKNRIENNLVTAVEIGTVIQLLFMANQFKEPLGQFIFSETQLLTVIFMKLSLDNHFIIKEIDKMIISSKFSARNGVLNSIRTQINKMQ
jgi:hypothetical protein